MKSIICFIGLLLMCFVTSAQTQIQVPAAEEKPVKISDKLYKIELKQPAECIQKMIYQKTGEAVDQELQDNGTTIIIKNYHEGTGVIVYLIYKNGNSDMIVKSPCSLELVTPL